MSKLLKRFTAGEIGCLAAHSDNWCAIDLLKFSSSNNNFFWQFQKPFKTFSILILLQLLTVRPSNIKYFYIEN